MRSNILRNQKAIAQRVIRMKASLCVLSVILFRSGYFLLLHSEAKKRSKITMNAKLALLAEWPEGAPKLVEQPNELKSDQAHTGRGSDIIIFILILTKEVN